MWSEAAKAKYDERKQCIIKQYSEYPVQEVNGSMSLNGKLTQGENIADNIGLRAAFAAYRASQTWEGRRSRNEKRLPGSVPTIFLIRNYFEKIFFAKLFNKGT